jgi:hypothetical protein
MKTMNQKKQNLNFKAITLFIAGALLTIPLFADEHSREYKAQTNVSTSDLIELSTAHCKEMIINTTDDNTASYTVTITIDVDDKELANKILDEVDYKISKSGNGIEMDLEWPFRSFSNSSGLFGAKTSITMKNGKKFDYSGRMKVKMIAEVNIPKKNKLEIEGRHSTLQLGHMSNEVEIDIEHATLNANDMKAADIDIAHTTMSIGNVYGETAISLSHSKLNGMKVGSGKIDLSHSRLELIETGNASVNLSHSNADIEKGGNMELNSMQHSELEIYICNN